MNRTDFEIESTKKALDDLAYHYKGNVVDLYKVEQKLSGYKRKSLTLIGRLEELIEEELYND